MADRVLKVLDLERAKRAEDRVLKIEQVSSKFREMVSRGLVKRQTYAAAATSADLERRYLCKST